MSHDQDVGQKHNIQSAKILWKCNKVQMFGTNSNKSKLHSWRN